MDFKLLLAGLLFAGAFVFGCTQPVSTSTPTPTLAASPSVSIPSSSPIVLSGVNVSKRGLYNSFLIEWSSNAPGSTRVYLANTTPLGEWSGKPENSVSLRVESNSDNSTYHGIIVKNLNFNTSYSLTVQTCAVVGGAEHCANGTPTSIVLLDSVVSLTLNGQDGDLTVPSGTSVTYAVHADYGVANLTKIPFATSVAYVPNDADFGLGNLTVQGTPVALDNDAFTETPAPGNYTLVAWSNGGIKGGDLSAIPNGELARYMTVYEPGGNIRHRSALVTRVLTVTPK